MIRAVRLFGGPDLADGVTRCAPALCTGFSGRSAGPSAAMDGTTGISGGADIIYGPRSPARPSAIRPFGIRLETLLSADGRARHNLRPFSMRSSSEFEVAAVAGVRPRSDGRRAPSRRGRPCGGFWLGSRQAHGRSPGRLPTHFPPRSRRWRSPPWSSNICTEGAPSISASNCIEIGPEFAARRLTARRFPDRIPMAESPTGRARRICGP